jgi:hypothetical protein
MKSLALLSLFAIIFLSSCNKYSEGPNFSLLTRKARITNDWVLESYTKDGTDLYDASYEMNLSIEKDGTFSKSVITPSLGQLQSVTTHGTWEFDNSQSSITLLEAGMLLGESYEIIMLKNKNLKLRQTDYNNSDYDWLFYSN